MKDCNHQSLRLVKVDGLKPANSQWYECQGKGCGRRLLMNVVTSVPQDPEVALAKKKGIVIQKRYMAMDKTTWPSPELADRRNALFKEVEEIESFLMPRTMQLEDGEGFIQQDTLQVEEVRARLHKLALKTFKKIPTKAVTLEQLLSDAWEEFAQPEDEHPIYRIYKRLSCIDKNSREWQTKELADEPSMGKQVQLNEISVPIRATTKEGSHEQRDRR